MKLLHFTKCKVRGVFRTLSIICDGTFCANSSIREVLLCPKYASKIIASSYKAAMLLYFTWTTRPRHFCNNFVQILFYGCKKNIKWLRWWLHDLGLPGWNSTCAAETDFTLRLHVQFEFCTGKVGQFSSWYLFRFVRIFSLGNWKPIDFQWFKSFLLELFSP